MGGNNWTDADWAAAAARARAQNPGQTGNGSQQPPTVASNGQPPRESTDSAAIKKEQ